MSKSKLGDTCFVKVLDCRQICAVNFRQFSHVSFFLQISFYEPTKSRHKIVLENKSFPSDHVSRIILLSVREER